MYLFELFNAVEWHSTKYKLDKQVYQAIPLALRHSWSTYASASPAKQKDPRIHQHEN